MRASRVAHVLSRALLFLHLVRGKDGVTMIGNIFGTNTFLRRLGGDIKGAALLKDLLKATRSRLRRLGLPATHLAHREGLLAGMTGLHPLLALATSTKARELFALAAQAWERVLAKVLCRGYCLSSQDVLSLHRAVRGKVGVAVHSGTLRTARAYTAMSLARSLAELVPRVFKRRLTD